MRMFIFLLLASVASAGVIPNGKGGETDSSKEVDEIAQLEEVKSNEKGRTGEADGAGMNNGRGRLDTKNSGKAKAEKGGISEVTKIEPPGPVAIPKKDKPESKEIGDTKKHDALPKGQKGDVEKTGPVKVEKVEPGKPEVLPSKDKQASKGDGAAQIQTKGPNGDIQTSETADDGGVEDLAKGAADKAKPEVIPGPGQAGAKGAMGDMQKGKTGLKGTPPGNKGEVQPISGADGKVPSASETGKTADGVNDETRPVGGSTDGASSGGVETEAKETEEKAKATETDPALSKDPAAQPGEKVSDVSEEDVGKTKTEGVGELAKEEPKNTKTPEAEPGTDDATTGLEETPGSSGADGKKSENPDKVPSETVEASDSKQPAAGDEAGREGAPGVIPEVKETGNPETGKTETESGEKVDTKDVEGENPDAKTKDEVEQTKGSDVGVGNKDKTKPTDEKKPEDADESKTKEKTNPIEQLGGGTAKRNDAKETQNKKQTDAENTDEQSGTKESVDKVPGVVNPVGDKTKTETGSKVDKAGSEANGRPENGKTKTEGTGRGKGGKKWRPFGRRRRPKPVFVPGVSLPDVLAEPKEQVPTETKVPSPAKKLGTPVFRSGQLFPKRRRPKPSKGKGKRKPAGRRGRRRNKNKKVQKKQGLPIA